MRICSIVMHIMGLLGVQKSLCDWLMVIQMHLSVENLRVRLFVVIWIKISNTRSRRSLYIKGAVESMICLITDPDPDQLVTWHAFQEHKCLVTGKCIMFSEMERTLSKFIKSLRANEHITQLGTLQCLKLAVIRSS